MFLQGWCAAERVLVTTFQLWWFEQHDKDPDNFPINMEPGEWDEQYRIWGDST